MKKKKVQLKVKCIFDDEGENAEELLLQSFRNFIQINIQKSLQNLI